MDKATIESNPRDAGPASCARRRCAAVIAALAAAIAFLPALAAEPELLYKLPSKPRLASLEIEIWPEYDRPSVLVFLKGELAAGANREISLRLPASSGGPTAVAHSGTAGGNLLNLPYERSDAKNFVTVRIQPPDRFFHIEFYDKLETAGEKREYRYVWPGDLGVDRLSVRIQQPSASKGFAITPQFSESASGNDTLIYWVKDMGAVAAGKELPIAIRYAKSDARTSKEMLGPVPSPAADALASSKPVSGLPPASDSGVPAVVEPHAYLIWAAIFALLAAAAAAILWRRRRAAAISARGAGFCTKCGNPLRSDDRFCSKCGTATSGPGTE